LTIWAKVISQEAILIIRMKRLTAYVSGTVQKVGYRAKVVDIARAFGLKGTIQNLSDGKVKIIVEGDENKLKWFEEAIDIKNTLIRVSSISREYSEATGDFDDFYKQVGPGETDSRLDQAVVILRDILNAVKAMNTDLKDMNSNLGSKIDGVGNKIDNVSNKIDGISNKMDGVGSKMDNLGNKIDSVGNKIDDNRADIVGEVRELRHDIKESELVRMKNDIAEIKAKLGQNQG
jgi:acylphosphatase